MKKKTVQQNAIIQAQKLGLVGKHAGSKPLSRILAGIRIHNKTNDINGHYERYVRQMDK